MSLYADRLRRLTLCEWKLREQSSLLGFLWSLLHPLLMFSVLYFVFREWMGGSMRRFSAGLLVGVVLYSFFHGATSYGLTSLRRRQGLLLNFALPRELVVLAAVLSAAISHAFEVGLMLLFLPPMGAPPAAGWLWFPVVAAANLALACGASLLLAAAAARVADLERVWSLALTAGFFLSPIFYAPESLPEAKRAWLWLNPMTWVIESARDCLVRGEPSPGRLLGLLAGSLAILAAGWGFFKARARSLADDLLVS